MKQLNGKTIILWILSVILCVTACGPAFASTGDAVLCRCAASEDGVVSYEWISSVWETDEGLCIIKEGSEGTEILRFADLRGEPETFVLKRTGIPEEAEAAEPAAPAEEAPAQNQIVFGFDDDDEDEEEEEDDDDAGFLVTSAAPVNGNENQAPETEKYDGYAPEYWFSWNGKLYVITAVQKTEDEKNKVEKLIIEHVKLEDGQVIREESGLPELDREYVVNDWDGSEYFSGLYNMFTIGNYLIGSTSAEMEQHVVVFDLTDGSCKAKSYTYDNNVEIAQAGDSILLSSSKWADDYSTADITLTRMNPADLSEEPMVELTKMKDSRVSPCYDQEKNTLYYVTAGQLWAMPELDPEKAQAVNECPETYPYTMLMPDGFVLIWSNKAVMLKNTDPSQRADITLRVYDGCYDGSEAVNEAIYELSKTRGDVSVAMEQDWGSSDIIQAMMNRDSQRDIYLLRYEVSEFGAMRKRGFLTDLSDNAEIAAYVERMYPWLRDAVTQDGKIIAVPLSVSADSININMRAWKKLGKTEDDLPKSWDEFFDWILTVPEILEGSEYALVETYMDQTNFRAMIAQAIINQYQIVMDAQGGDYSYNSPLLSGLLKKLIELDYGKLGIVEHYDFEDDEMEGGDGQYREALLNSYGYGPFNRYSEGTPLPLRLSDEYEAVVPGSICAAFVNPYSEHPEEAKELLALVMKSQDATKQYAYFTDKTEPIERPDADEMRKNQAELMEKLQKELENSKDEQDKALVEESIREMEKSWEENQDELWVISQGMIDEYLKLSPLFKVQDYILFDELWSSEDNKERTRIVKGLFGYEDSENPVGDVSLEETLNLIDQKIQMKRKEGN